MQVDYWSSTKKIQLKENSTENSTERNFKGKILKFKKLWNFSMKQKKKIKILKFKELVSSTLSQISFPEIVLKICNTFSLLSISFLFLCIKFLFKNFILCVIFRTNIRTRKLRNLLLKLFKLIFIIKGFLPLYCFFHNVSADMSSDLLQVFVEFGNLQGTSNYVLYWIHGGHLFWFR